MSAARPRRNVAKITTRPQCGGDKLQGLAPHATKFSISANNNYQYSTQSGDGRDRRLIYLTNQLAGGVGRHRSQFRNNADGPRRGSGCHDPPKLEIINDPHDNGNVLHVNNFQVTIYAGREGTLSLSEGSVTPSYVSRGTHTIRVHINHPSGENFKTYTSELTLTDKANNKTTKNLNPFTINSQIFQETHITSITREEIGAFLRFTIEFDDKKQHNLLDISLNTNQGYISLDPSFISTTTNDVNHSITAGPFLYGLTYSNLSLTVNPTNGSSVVYTSVGTYDLSDYTAQGSYKLLEYAYVKFNTNYNNFSYNHEGLVATKDSILPYFRFLPTYDYYRLDLSNLIPIGDISFILDNGDNTFKIASDLSMETSFNLLYFDSNKDLVEKQISAIFSYYSFTETKLPTSGVRIKDTSNIDSTTFASNKRNDDYWMWEVSGITPTYSPKWSSNANTDDYIWNDNEPDNHVDTRNPVYDNYFTDASIGEGYIMINAFNKKKLNDVAIRYIDWNNLIFDGALYLREHNVVSITDLCDTIINIYNTNANINYSNSVPFRGFLIKDNCDNLINSPLLSENNKMIPITSTMLPPDSNTQNIEHAIKTMYSS